MAFLDFIFRILFERITVFLRSSLITLDLIPPPLRRAVGGPRSPSAGICCTVARRSTATSEMVRSLRQGSLYETRWRQSFGILLIFLSFVVFGMGEARAQSKEYQIKAAFLFNFAQFVQWPATAFTEADAPFCIGILGDDPFGTALEETIQGETVNRHKLLVRHAQRFEDLEDCQLIFVSKSEEGNLADIFSKLDSKPILTVSEIDSFAENGGAINFYLQGNKVRFEINPGSAQRGGLKISSQLLSLGKVIAR